MGQAPSVASVWVLNPSVEIVPIKDFPEAIQVRLGGTPSDFILSERKSRLRSQRIDAETATFLQRFTEPTRVVDAILDHAVAYGAEPSSILEDAYPLLVSLRDHGILVTPTDAVRSEVGLIVFDDNRFGSGLKILRSVRVLADTEVYEGELPDGTRVAIKYLPISAPSSVRQSLEHEYRILRHANAQRPGCVPTLFDASFDRVDPYLVLAWRDGQPIDVVARDLRCDLAMRKRIMLNLLATYNALHEAGILHGDVQPNNVLVDRAGGVSLVDFGGASSLPTGPTPQRVVFLPHAEPELANAYRNNRPAPPPSPTGEQYGVAVLAYLVITGQPYLDLALETDLALRQIAYDPPRRLRDMGLDEPEVERVLLRALEKDPRARYPTFAAFTQDLRTAIDEPAKRQIGAVESIAPETQVLAEYTTRFVRCEEELLEDYGLDGALIHTGLRRGPTASIYYGAAGIAYALLRLGCIREGPEIVAMADVWIEQALLARTAPTAFLAPDIGLMPSMTGPGSLLNALPGLYVVKALVRHVSGDPSGHRAAVHAFVADAENAVRSLPSKTEGSRTFPLDVAHGAAGLLLGATLLFPSCTAASGTLAAELRRSGSALQSTVEAELVTASGGDAERALLGFAHGRAGALFALIRWAEVSGGAASPLVEPHLKHLAALSRQRGSERAWPIEAGVPASPCWSGWCHGSAGHLLLWLAAARAYDNQHYRSLAEAAGEHIWRTRRQASASLCCGLAGEALALFDLARESQSEQWLERGRMLAALATESRMIDAVPHSLFRGDVGVRLVAVEAQDGANAQWPLCYPPA